MAFLCVALASGVVRAEVTRVFILAGQSNMVGKGNAADLPEADRQPQQDVRFAARIIRGSRPTSGPASTWGPLQLGTGEAANGQGFGPEIGFGRAMANAVRESGAKEHVAIIKFARSGANLREMFHPDATSGLKLYPQMIDFVRDRLHELGTPGDEVKLEGFFWYQGEADTTGTEEDAKAFAANLSLLISRVRKDLGVPELPFVAVRVNPHLERHKFRDIVRDAIVRVMEQDPHGAWVNVDDLNQPDNLHLDAAGQIEAGKRLATAWRQAAKKK